MKLRFGFHYFAVVNALKTWRQTGGRHLLSVVRPRVALAIPRHKSGRDPLQVRQPAG
jgi:hypothetical protein